MNIWFDVERSERVLFRVDPAVAQYFKKRQYFPLQKIVSEEKDGALIIQTYPARFEEISHTIMHWIPFLTILEPETVKKEIRSTIESYLKSF